MNNNSYTGRIYVLLPTMQPNFFTGGYYVLIRMVELLQIYAPTRIVTCWNKERNYDHLDDVLRISAPEDLFIINSSPHVTDLAKLLSGRRVIYYAQSFGWKISLPISMPIFCISRYVLSQWAIKSPSRPLFLLPPVVEFECQNEHRYRDIDVLTCLIREKSPPYVSELMEQLQKKYRTQVIKKLMPREKFIDHLKRTKVFLYYSKPILESGGAEGFGLMPLEALLCGCKVFSNLFGGLADYLEPAVNASQLGVYSMEYDFWQISGKLNGFSNLDDISDLRHFFSETMFHRRISRILKELEIFFEYTSQFLKPD